MLPVHYRQQLKQDVAAARAEVVAAAAAKAATAVPAAAAAATTTSIFAPSVSFKGMVEAAATSASRVVNLFNDSASPTSASNMSPAAPLSRTSSVMSKQAGAGGSASFAKAVADGIAARGSGVGARGSSSSPNRLQRAGAGAGHPSGALRLMQDHAGWKHHGAAAAAEALPFAAPLKSLDNTVAAEAYLSGLPPGQLHVSLSAAGLTSFPALGHLPFLASLGLSFNKLAGPLSGPSLAALPPTNLRLLCLSHNGITSLPPAFGEHLQCLQQLDLSHNALGALPDSIADMPLLSGLNVSHNELLELPTRMGRLTLLERLLARHNKLTQLPDAFAAMPMLFHVDVSYNRLFALPASLAACASLEHLDISSNALFDLPRPLLTSSARLAVLLMDRNELHASPLVTGQPLAKLQGQPLTRMRSNSMKPIMRKGSLKQQ